MRSSNLLRLTTLFVVALPALAQERAARNATDGADKPAEKGIKLAGVKLRFERCDSDHGGALDAKEAEQAGLGPRDFSSYDANQDQKLGADEFVIAFHSVMSARGAKIGDDLAAEVARIRAATPQPKPAAEPVAPTELARPRTDGPRADAPRADGPRGDNARGDGRAQVTPPVPPEEAKATLESKVDSALRAAQGEQAEGARTNEPPRRERAAPADGSPAKANIEAKAADAEAALNRRLRNAEVAPDVAAEERSKLRKRVANALGENPPPQPGAPESPSASGSEQPAPSEPVAPPADSPAPPADPTQGIEAKAKAMEAALEQRMRNQGKSDAEIAAAKEQLKTRVDNALSKGQKPNDAGSGDGQPPTRPATDLAKPPEARERPQRGERANPDRAGEARVRPEGRGDKPPKGERPHDQAGEGQARPKPQPPAESKGSPPRARAKEKQQASTPPPSRSVASAISSSPKRPYQMQPAARLPVTMPSLPPPPRIARMPATGRGQSKAPAPVRASTLAIQAVRLEQQRVAANTKPAPAPQAASKAPAPRAAAPQAQRANDKPATAKPQPKAPPVAANAAKAAGARGQAAKGAGHAKPDGAKKAKAKPAGEKKAAGGKKDNAQRDVARAKPSAARGAAKSSKQPKDG